MMHLDRAPRIHRRARSDRLARSVRGEQRGFQIGPRIRIGGTLGHIGQKVKEGVGKMDKAVAPFVSMVPGIGPELAAALNIAGHLYDTSDGGVHLNNLPSLALSTGAIYGGGKLAGKVLGKIPGVSGALSHIPGMGGGSGGADVVGDGAPGDGTAAGGGSSWWDKAKGIFGDVEGAGKSLLGLGGGGGGGGGNSLIDKGLLVASVADMAARRKRQQDLQNQGLKFATDAYTANAPVRDKGRSLLLHQNAPDLSGIFGNDPNPYAKPFQLASAAPVRGASAASPVEFTPASPGSITPQRSGYNVSASAAPPGPTLQRSGYNVSASAV